MKQIQEKSFLVRVNGEFGFLTVRVVRAYMYLNIFATLKGCKSLQASLTI